MTIKFQIQSNEGFLLDIERIAVAGCNHLVVLFPFVLDNQFDLVLQTEKKEDGLFSGNSIHFHIIDLRVAVTEGNKKRRKQILILEKSNRQPDENHKIEVEYPIETSQYLEII